MRASYNESTDDRSIDAPTREVRRYPNRRMYDTKERTYVALDEIARWIDAGQRVRVVDVKTNDDVTIAVLLPIAVDRAAKLVRGVSGADLVHRWIREGISLPNSPEKAVLADPLPIDVRLHALEARVTLLERSSEKRLESDRSQK